MEEQKHTGTGDNVQGNKTEIDRQINLGDDSTYIEKQTIIYGDKKILKYLTNPPFFPDIFEGRATDLENIHGKLFGTENSLLLVNGEGGMGKTSVAAKYWEKYADAYSHLAWVFAEKNMRDALLNMASKLHITFPKEMEADERFSELLVALTNLKTPCLLVIDNANDIEDLERYYNAIAGCKNFHVLFTSRITAFENAPAYKIQPLSPKESIKVFKKHFSKQRESDNDLLLQLRDAVGGNTLVMELMAKNLAVINSDEVFYGLNDLVNDFKNLGLLHISQEEKVSVAEKGKHHAYLKIEPTRVIAALYDEMEHIKQLTDYEKELLSNLAVLPAENIGYEMLKTLLTPDDTRTFSKTLTSLAQRGWIEKSNTDDDAVHYKISPVVQHITREKNKNLILEHNDALIYTLADKLAYELGTGHFINATYEEADFFSNYAESVIGNVDDVNNNLSVLCERIGNYEQSTGNLEKALWFYEEYNRLKKELYAAYPTNVSFKYSLAISYSKLGQTHTALGNLEKALGFFEKDLELTKELYAANPTNVSFKNSLAISYSKLGETYTDLGNLEKALGFFEEYNRLEKELYAANPTNVSFKNSLAISYSKLGETHTALGNLEKALDFLKECSRLIEELYAAYPTNVSFKNSLAISYSKLGQTHTALGNLEKALDFLKECSRLSEELYAAYPTNVSFKNSLAISYSKLGQTHTALGNLEKALGFYEEYNRLKKELYAAYPTNVSFKNGLAISYSKLGETYTALGNLEKALGFYEEYNRLEKELYAAYPSNVSFKNNLAISYSQLGQTYTALGNLEKALGFFEELNRLEKELYAAYPTNVSFKNGLAISFAKLGEFYRDNKKDKHAARGYFQSAEKLWLELVRDAPQFVEFQKNLLRVQNVLAKL